MSHDCHMTLSDGHMIIRLEEQGKIDSAMECYREALTLDPDQGVAKERVEAITAAIEAKVCWLLCKKGRNSCMLASPSSYSSYCCWVCCGPLLQLP